MSANAGPTHLVIIHGKSMLELFSAHASALEAEAVSSRLEMVTTGYSISVLAIPAHVGIAPAVEPTVTRAPPESIPVPPAPQQPVPPVRPPLTQAQFEAETLALEASGALVPRVLHGRGTSPDSGAFS